MDNTYFTVEQVSELLSLHPKTVQRYIREGKLRATKIGKGWRIAGHDLSVFTENAPEIPQKSAENATGVTVSAVADITVRGKDEAIRIMTSLSAALNSKPSGYGPSSLHTQYIESSAIVRVTLWGGARFTAVMMDAIAALTDNNEMSDHDDGIRF